MSMPVGGAPMPPPAEKSSRATTSLVLGILGVTCCHLCAPFAWMTGSNELKAIAAGLAPAAGEGTAKAGKILGIIGTIFLVFTVFWIFFAGGMAILQGIAASHNQ